MTGLADAGLAGQQYNLRASYRTLIQPDSTLKFPVDFFISLKPIGPVIRGR